MLPRPSFHQLVTLSLATLAICFTGSLTSNAHAAPAAASRGNSASGVENFDGQNVISIDVQGLKRIEKDAVLNKFSTKVGQPLLLTNVRLDIQAVFATGYFDDISFQGEPASGGVKLTIALHERPVISKVEFEGNERLTTTDLQEVIKVKEWSILDINKVKEDTNLISKHYEDKGFYLAKVTFEIKQTKPDEVELKYKINDFDKVQIKRITFLNNRHFTDDQLKATLGETREGGLFSFLSSSGNFKESAFKQDLQRLTYWYLDHGYVKFRYENPIVTVSDDKKWLFITLYVEEGEQYKMGPMDFSGDLLFPKEEMSSELTLKSDETFSISRRNADIQHLTEKYQDLGYAFVNVVPKMNVHDDTKLVDIDYSFEKGNLVHFGEINILGNSKTHDKVIRRELKISEGELYSGTRLRQSRENVERLGYFAPGEVIFNTVTPKGKPDILNVEITIKERSTGTITLGAGYGSVQKFFFTTQISEINLMGRGQTLSLSGQVAADKLSKSLNLGFTDPYIFDSKWSAGFDLFFVNFPIPSKYTTRKLGFDIRFGYPVFEYTNAYITYKNEGLKIEDADASIDPNDIKADQGVLSSVVWSIIRDKRNNRFETTEGNYQSLSLETAGIGGDKKFVKTVANNRYYKRLVGNLVFRNSTEFGDMQALGGRELPPSERFYLGGPNNLKGYQIFSVGPYRNRLAPGSAPGSTVVIREPLGGSVSMFSLFELEHPLIKEAGLKVVAFYDIGNTFAGFPGGDLKLRSDAGFGIRWFSPIGPLRFEWGFPFKRQPGEDENVFQFFIGPPF
ncbi:MAG: outer membrane protein assembly factor BamA [Methylotenera sp.]|nr:outer membrane protein assembly factor BamA [Oligoflexia bacterium]